MSLLGSMAIKAAGMGLSYMGNKKQEKANNAAMDQANAAQSQYDQQMQAWQDQQNASAAAHADRQRREMQAWEDQQRSDKYAHQMAEQEFDYLEKMEQWEKQRDAEMSVLQDQGATMEELAAHDQGMREQFMAEAQAFGPEAFQEGVAANTESAQAEGEGALTEVREERAAPAEGRSTKFQEAAAAAMEGADAKSDKYLSGMSGLTGRTRERGGESSALRNIGIQNASGNRAAEAMKSMAGLRQQRKGYVQQRDPYTVKPMWQEDLSTRPTQSTWTADTSSRPTEPNMNINTSNSGNWMSAIGGMVGSAGNVYDNYKRWGK